MPSAGPARVTRWGLLPVGASRYSWLTLLNTWVTWALNVVTFTMVYSVGSRIIDDFHLSAAAWGWVVAGYLGVRVLCDLPATMLSDRIGPGWRRRYLWFPIMCEYAVVGALVAVPGLSSSLWGFFLLIAGVAVGTTASEALGVVASVEWWPREQRGFAVGLHHTGYPVGALVGGWFAGWVLHTFGDGDWRLVYLSSLATLPFAVWYWFLSSRRNFEEVEAGIRRRGLTSSVAAGRERVTLRSCLGALRSREVAVAAVCVFLFQAMQNVFQTTYPEYLAFVGGYSYAAVASMSVVWAITGAFFQFLWPTLSDRLGRKWFIVGAGVIQGVVFLLLPLSTSLAGVVLVQLLYGVTLNAVFPLLFSTAADVAGPRVGSALGAVFSATWLGAVGGTLLGTQLLSSGGGFHSGGAYRTVYHIMIVLSAVIVLARLAGRETNPRGRRAARTAGKPADATAGGDPR
jgi:MFS family permease